MFILKNKFKQKIQIDLDLKEIITRDRSLSKEKELKCEMEIGKKQLLNQKQVIFTEDDLKL